MTHSSLNHNENMPYPVWKSCRTGFRILSIIVITVIHYTTHNLSDKIEMNII